MAAIIRGWNPKRRRFSAMLIKEALVYWYHEDKLCPRGVSVYADSVQDWCLRTGHAARKLAASQQHRCISLYCCAVMCPGPPSDLCGAQASKFKRLSRRARSSRNKALRALKVELRDYLPATELAQGEVPGLILFWLAVTCGLLAVVRVNRVFVAILCCRWVAMVGLMLRGWWGVKG